MTTTMLVPTGQSPGIKREHGRVDLDGTRSVAVPATVSGESGPINATGKPGRLDLRLRPASQETCQRLVTQPPGGESGGAAKPLVVAKVIAMRMSSHDGYPFPSAPNPGFRTRFAYTDVCTYACPYSISGRGYPGHGSGVTL